MVDKTTGPKMSFIGGLFTSFLLCRNKSYIAFCLGGFRSTIATSILNKLGFKVQDVIKGFASISVNAPELTTTGKVRGV